MTKIDENISTGYIKLYRSLKQHWLWKDKTRLVWWLTILMEVNHTPKKILIKGTLLDCGRGQSLNSLETWAKEFRCTIQQVRTFFELLKKDGMINVEGLQKTTRLTVCNYDNYNKNQQTDNKQTTDTQHADNRQITTNKNFKNVKHTQPAYEEVERVFVQQGGTKEMSKAFFDKHTATGWMIKGTEIKDYSSLVPSFIRTWNEIRENQNANHHNQQQKQASVEQPKKYFDLSAINYEK